MKRLLFFTPVAWLALCRVVLAALAIDSVATPGTGTTSTTHSHNIGASANLLVICPAERDGGNSVQPVASVTVDSVAATPLDGLGTGVGRIEFWYMLSPTPNATASIVATGGSGTDQMVTGSISFTGAAQTSTFNTVKKAGPTTGINADLDTMASAVGELALACVQMNGSHTCAADAGTPVSVEKWDTNSGGQTSSCGYTEDGAATLDMRVDINSSADWVAMGVSIRPLVATAVRHKSELR